MAHVPKGDNLEKIRIFNERDTPVQATVKAYQEPNATDPPYAEHTITVPGKSLTPLMTNDPNGLYWVDVASVAITFADEAGTPLPGDSTLTLSMPVGQDATSAWVGLSGYGPASINGKAMIWGGLAQGPAGSRTQVVYQQAFPTATPALPTGSPGTGLDSLVVFNLRPKWLVTELVAYSESGVPKHTSKLSAPANQVCVVPGTGLYNQQPFDQIRRFEARLWLCDEQVSHTWQPTRDPDRVFTCPPSGATGENIRSIQIIALPSPDPSTRMAAFALNCNGLNLAHDGS